MRTKIIGLVAIGILSLAAAVLLMLGRTDYEVGLDAAVEIWADVARDADFIGLSLTRVSAEREMEIGRDISQRMRYWGRPGSDNQLQRYVESVGRELLDGIERKDIEYEFHVVNAAYINAFALPGGHVYVTTGMLAFLETEAELAAVLGHEISHIDLRHCIERMQYELAARKIVGDLAGIVGLAHELVGVGYSEQQELEADRHGVLLSAQAGYDWLGGMDTFSRLARQEIEEQPLPPAERPAGIGLEVLEALWDGLRDYFASHPATPGRARALAALARRNASQMLGREFYVGRVNHRARVPRATQARDDEWIIYDTMPEIVDCEIAPGIHVATRLARCR